jgi:hypothetical protein
MKKFVNDNVQGAGKFSAALWKNKTVSKWNDLKIAGVCKSIIIFNRIRSILTSLSQSG